MSCSSARRRAELDGHTEVAVLLRRGARKLQQRQFNVPHRDALLHPQALHGAVNSDPF